MKTLLIKHVSLTRLLPCFALASVLACSNPDNTSPEQNAPKGKVPPKSIEQPSSFKKAAQLLIDGKVLDLGKQLLFDLVRGGLSAEEIAKHGEEMTWAKKELSDTEKSTYLAKTVGNVNLDNVVVSITATSLPYKLSANGKPATMVNFADSNLFYGFLSDGLFVQDEIMIANLLHLALWRMVHSTDGQEKTLPPGKKIQAGASTAIFRRVPQYVQPLEVGSLYGDSGQFLQKAQAAAKSDANKKNFKNILKSIVKRGSIDIHNPPKVNVLAMAAPNGGANRRESFFLTACCGFSQADGYVLTGNWGGGVFGNPISLTAKAQIAAAIATGTQIEVHAFSQEECKQWKKAKDEMQQAITSNPSAKLIDLIDKV